MVTNSYIIIVSSVAPGSPAMTWDQGTGCNATSLTMQKVASRQNKGCGSDNSGGVRAEHCHHLLIQGETGRCWESSMVPHTCNPYPEVRASPASEEDSVQTAKGKGGLLKCSDITYSI